MDDVAKIGRIIVRESQDHPTRILDVARVEDGGEEPKTLAAEDGKESWSSPSGSNRVENTVAVVDAVRARLGEVEKTMSGGSSCASFATIRHPSARASTP